MADLGTLFVSIDADTKKFDKAINNTEKKTTNLGKSFKKFGDNATKFATLPILGIGAGLVKLTTSIGQSADKLLDLEQITGLSTDTLQEFKNVATVAGVSFEGLTGIVQKFTSRLPTIQAGTSESAKAFEQLNVNLKDTSGEIRSAEELVPELITALQGIENVTERNAVAQQVFGRSLGDLAPVLGLTAEETRKARDEAKELGLVWDRDSIVKANEFRVQTEQLTEQFKRQGVELGSALIPIFQKALPAISDLIEKVSDGVEFFSELDDSAKNLIIGIAGFTASIGPAIKLVTALKVAFTALTGPVGIVVTALAGVVAGVKALQELKLAQLQGQFGELSKETGLTIEEIDFANTRLNQFINTTDDVGESLLLVAKDTGIAYNELVKLAAISENLTEEERALYQRRADNIRKFEGEYEAFTNKYDEENQKQLDSTSETVDQAIEKILELTDTEKQALEEREAKREELNQANQERLNTAFATDLERLQLRKEAEILNAQELGANIFEIEQFYALEKIRVQDEQKAKEIADQEEITKKIEEENRKRQAFILSTTDSIIGIVNNLQQIELNNVKAKEQRQIEALDKQALGEEAYAEEVKRIQKETAKEQNRIQREQFEANKALSLIQIAINTAVGVSQAIAQGGIFGIATGAIVAAAGAAQAALVASQPPPPLPALATGGIIPESRRGVDVTVGEAGSRGDIVLGAGAKGKALRDLVAGDMANTMMSKMGGQQQPIVINLYGRSLVSKSELDQFARDLRPALVREDQRRGARQ